MDAKKKSNVFFASIFYSSIIFCRCGLWDWIVSEPGNGSTFTVELPFADAMPVQRETILHLQEKNGTERFCRKESIAGGR